MQFNNFSILLDCVCYVDGTTDRLCYANKCQCKEEYAEPHCDKCAEGWFGFPDCRPCNCFFQNTLLNSKECDATSGQCKCNDTITGQFGKQCSPCEIGKYYNEDDWELHDLDEYGEHPAHYEYYVDEYCTLCDCDREGTQDEICDAVTGKCFCKNGYAAPRCDTCLVGFSGPTCSGKLKKTY